jgi:hypothetical protein
MFWRKFFIAGEKHVAPTELMEGISPAFSVLQTYHSYGVYEWEVLLWDLMMTTEMSPRWGCHTKNCLVNFLLFIRLLWSEISPISFL